MYAATTINTESWRRYSSSSLLQQSKVFCYGLWIITQLGVGEGALQLGLQVLCCWFIVRKIFDYRAYR
ncbi:hypothetical protein LINPERPRIM_LOCUS28495 [Linum perenne]